MALIDHLALGGAELLLGQFAAAAPWAGIELSVACLAERNGNPAAARLIDAGILPRNLDVPGRPGLSTLHKVRRYIAQLNPDVVHTHLGTSDWVGGLAARSLGIPAVSSIHTSVWENDLETNFKRWVVRVCTDRVIAVSDHARQAYAEHAWASDGQLVTIHNGIDVRAVPGAGREVRREFGWTDDHLVVGMVSALRPEKGHEVALEAVRILQDRFPTLRLLVLGRGPSEHVIARLARDLDGIVVLAGPRYDVMNCFDAFDVCLHPSRADAFPTTLIEAMAASVPVVATAVGGIPEIVRDGQTGVMVPAPPDAKQVATEIAALLGDRERRLQIAAMARADYEQRLTARPWVDSTRAVYDDVLAASPRRRGSDGAGSIREQDRG